MESSCILRLVAFFIGLRGSESDRCNWLLYLSWLKDEIIPLIKYLDILGSQAQSVGMLPDPLGIDLFIHAKLNCCNYERRALHVRV